MNIFGKIYGENLTIIHLGKGGLVHGSWNLLQISKYIYLHRYIKNTAAVMF